MTALKTNKKKVLLAIGGWNDSAGNKYSRLVSDPQARRNFNKKALEFLEKYNFDGLDLDWEYPKCWQVDCDKGPSTDKENFARWVEELSMMLKPKGMLLSAAVSPSKKVIDAGYDVPKLSKYFDYISVMTYDYHGQWDKKTGHVSPMYDHPMNSRPEFNTNYTVHYWIEKGLDKKKLIMGIPLYGQSFTLASARDNGLKNKTFGGGTAGEFTRARGFLAYYEICHNVINKGWKLVRDPKNRMGPYAYKGTEWVGFDDIETVKYKTEYIRNMGLGGAMVWALDLDDFRNRCGCERHPLLRTINRGLGRLGSVAPDCKLTSSFRIQEDDLRAEAPAAPYKGCMGNAKYAPADTCENFLVCNGDTPVLTPCPDGLHWSKSKNVCDWPKDANCKPGDNGDDNQGGNYPAYPEQDNNIDLSPVRPPSPQETQGSSEDDRYPQHPGVYPEVPDTGMKVVCYFTNWAWYRNGAGKYTPDHIDPSLCTHVNYGFAVLDSERLVMKPHDTWADLDNKFYEKVVNVCNVNIYVSAN